MWYTPTHIHTQQYKHKGFYRMVISIVLYHTIIFFSNNVPLSIPTRYLLQAPSFPTPGVQKMKKNNILSAMKQNGQGL